MQRGNPLTAKQAASLASSLHDHIGVADYSAEFQQISTLMAQLLNAPDLWFKVDPRQFDG